jgi:uncharacterized membrane protein YtjA (UPF0391 family)
MPAGNLLYYALVALVIALIADFLCFGGIAGAAAGIAQILFYVFLVIFLVVLVMNSWGAAGGRSPKQTLAFLNAEMTHTASRSDIHPLEGAGAASTTGRSPTSISR